MKEEIENLIQQHKLAKDECFGHLEELSILLNTKISKEEKEAVKTLIAQTSKEYDMRFLFISELESLL